MSHSFLANPSIQDFYISKSIYKFCHVMFHCNTFPLSVVTISFASVSRSISSLRSDVTAPTKWINKHMRIIVREVYAVMALELARKYQAAH